MNDLEGKLVDAKLKIKEKILDRYGDGINNYDLNVKRALGIIDKILDEELGVAR